jgi:hypothetical protein
MENNLPAPTKAFAAAIQNAKTPEDLQDVLRQFKTAQGLPSLYDGHILEAQYPPTRTGAQPTAEASKADDRLFRRAVTLDNGVVRLIEAFSVGGLDVLEQALRGKRI